MTFKSFLNVEGGHTAISVRHVEAVIELDGGCVQIITGNELYTVKAVYANVLEWLANAG